MLDEELPPSEVTFEAWPKIPRLDKLRTVITEKLDGTNAQVIITDDGRIAAGSRTRLITPGKLTDNYGFAGWVEDNKEELLKMGPGRHFGEWWGQGIQRGYGLTEKRFSLFNVRRWGEHNPNTPDCVSVVPVIEVTDPNDAMTYLTRVGSLAVPGWMRPEGIVVFFGRDMYKDTFEAREGKWKEAS